MDTLSQIDWTRITGQIGLGALLGVAVGYAAKKAIKVVLIIVALLLVTNIALSKAGFLTVNWTAVEAWWDAHVLDPGPETLVQSMFRWFTTSIALSGSFIGGFIFGFRAG